MSTMKDFSNISLQITVVMASGHKYMLSASMDIEYWHFQSANCTSQVVAPSSYATNHGPMEPRQQGVPHSPRIIHDAQIGQYIVSPKKIGCLQTLAIVQHGTVGLGNAHKQTTRVPCMGLHP
jgi:hypothetical protein